MLIRLLADSTDHEFNRTTTDANGQFNFANVGDGFYRGSAEPVAGSPYRAAQARYIWMRGGYMLYLTQGVKVFLNRP